MTNESAVVLAGRILGIYFLFWGLFDLTYLPDQLYALSHHLAYQSVLSADHYYRNLNLMQILLIFARVAALFALSMAFFRNGPRTQRLLAGALSTPEK